MNKIVSLLLFLTLSLFSCSNDFEEIIIEEEPLLFLEKVDGIMWGSEFISSVTTIPAVFMEFNNDNSNSLKRWGLDYSTNAECTLTEHDESYEILEHTETTLKIKKTRYDGHEETMRYRINGMTSVIHVKYYGSGQPEDESKYIVSSWTKEELRICDLYTYIFN